MVIDIGPSPDFSGLAADEDGVDARVSLLMVMCMTGASPDSDGWVSLIEPFSLLSKSVGL